MGSQGKRGDGVDWVKIQVMGRRNAETCGGKALPEAEPGKFWRAQGPRVAGTEQDG